MDDQQLYLDHESARRGAAELHASGTEFRRWRHTAGAGIVAAGAAKPWGNDDIGASFDKNYRPIEQQIMQAWQQLADYLVGLAEAAARSVDDNQAADARAGANVTRAYPKPPLP